VTGRARQQNRACFSYNSLARRGGCGYDLAGIIPGNDDLRGLELRTNRSNSWIVARRLVSRLGM